MAPNSPFDGALNVMSATTDTIFRGAINDERAIVRSDGDVETANGHVTHVEMTWMLIDDLAVQASVPEVASSIWTGHYLVQTDNQGFVTVFRYADQAAAERDFDRMFDPNWTDYTQPLMQWSYDSTFKCHALRSPRWPSFYASVHPSSDSGHFAWMVFDHDMEVVQSGLTPLLDYGKARVELALCNSIPDYSEAV